MLKKQIKNSLLQRLSEPPLDSFPSRDPMVTGTASKIELNETLRKSCSKAMEALHLHPCYLINLFSQRAIEPDEFYRYLKEIYNNRLLCSSLKQPEEIFNLQIG